MKWSLLVGSFALRLCLVAAEAPGCPQPALTASQELQHFPRSIKASAISTNLLLQRQHQLIPMHDIYIFIYIHLFFFPFCFDSGKNFQQLLIFNAPACWADRAVNQSFISCPCVACYSQMHALFLEWEPYIRPPLLEKKQKQNNYNNNKKNPFLYTWIHALASCRWDSAHHSSTWELHCVRSWSADCGTQTLALATSSGSIFLPVYTQTSFKL